MKIDSLKVEAVYRNTQDWQNESDEFNRFFRFSDRKGSTSGITNVAGFRPKSKVIRNTGSTNGILDCAFCVLVTNLGESEWPDELDREAGVFTYYGDNRKPGRSVDETRVGGNRLLAYVFEQLHGHRRSKIMPFLCFESTKIDGRSFMRFLGLACPGAQGLSAVEDLVGVWRITEGQRFQNYRALFSILDVDRVPWSWLNDLVEGVAAESSVHCPKAWRDWSETGKYRNLTCEPERRPRPKSEQLPKSDAERIVLRTILDALKPREFEFAALELVRLMDRRFVELEVTRPSRDGGRDVVGKYVIGHPSHRVGLEVLIEAKFYSENKIGVGEMMRLVSRIKHRDLGVFITTSTFDVQVQQELLDDRHPVLLVSGGDIARLLIAHDLGSQTQLSSWLSGIKRAAGESLVLALPTSEAS